MTFRFYLFIMTLATVAAWIAWVIVINAIDPVRAGVLGFILFFVTLAIALIGSLSILGIGIRVWLRPEGSIARQTSRSVRHAVLLTLLFSLSLLLASNGLLRWWIVLLTVFTITLAELAFITHEKVR